MFFLHLCTMISLNSCRKMIQKNMIYKLVVAKVGSMHRYLIEVIASDINKSIADQLAMQIRKLACDLWVISINRYLWLKNWLF